MPNLLKKDNQAFCWMLTHHLLLPRYWMYIGKVYLPTCWPKDTACKTLGLHIVRLFWTTKLKDRNIIQLLLWRVAISDCRYPRYKNWTNNANINWCVDASWIAFLSISENPCLGLSKLLNLLFKVKSMCRAIRTFKAHSHKVCLMHAAAVDSWQLRCCKIRKFWIFGYSPFYLSQTCQLQLE